MLTLMAPATVITAVRGTDTAAATPLLIMAAGTQRAMAMAMLPHTTADTRQDMLQPTTVPAESFVAPMRTAALATIGGIAIAGLFAGLAAHFHGIPTEYSHRKTLTVDAPQVLSRLRDDGADAAILCPL